VPAVDPQMLHEVFEPEVGVLQGYVEDIEAGCHSGISMLDAVM
jgi:hypothetical protein